MDPLFWAGLFEAAPGILNETFGFWGDVFGVKRKDERMQEAVLNAQQNMLQMQIDGALELDRHKTERQKQMFDFWTENMTYCVGAVAIVSGAAVAISSD